MLRYLYVVIILLAINVKPVMASKPVIVPKQAAVLKVDSSTVNLRNFDKASLSTYSKQNEFQYKEEIETGASLWTRFWRWFWNWFIHLFDFSKKARHSSSFWDGVIILLEYLGLLLGLGALIFFILKLVGIDMFNIFRRKPVIINVPYSESLENIHEIDFDTALESAISQHNYRLAVRLLYLNCLKQLSDATLINWQPDKTNSVYLTELHNTRQYPAFKLLTRQFEYIWYGEFPIDGSVFQNINVTFQKFNKDIS
jgi:Domain of unknown function (DUF4129)